ncbi:MAG: DarT ssDNA thymidine ADP-ribosyltransferase family protein [Pseudomonadota bacterium]
MPIPAPHSNRFFYHFTHIDNLPGLLETGLLAKGHPNFPKDVRSIAAEGIQARRSQMDVTCGPGGVVHDYVPFYFGSLSPMLLGVIHKKNIDQFDLLYFEFPISLLEREDVVFADASANTDIPPNFFEDPEDLASLNWGEIDSLKWKSASDELRHQRMAEVLFHDRVPLSLASNCVVWNKAAKKEVEALTKGVHDFPKLTFELPARRHFFTKFMIKEERGQSLVTGPKGIASMYESVCEHFEKNIGKDVTSAPFSGPKALLKGLRDGFGCIEETAELIGLKTVNKVHKETVDIHTKQVVQTLLGLPEYGELNPRQRSLVELAAYLHDIGKGPKERWLNEETGECFQKNDPDHPVRAMPMVARILTEEVERIKLENAKLIAKLVCYHDLVGDVIGRERNEQQIAEISDSEEELTLLFLLGKADATTLGFWWNQEKADAIYARALQAIEAK